ncbi:hypothetical protein AAFF_G00067060 [Aldrovandia affinis]|uniref:Uncharacterized protein n=1 Tax=Aldrovandia affinis TaxID=143900 RepID=A0AAD7T536_9TELE|nr:hypothetical protein AAFF_G00067060 [Aldrovandia affinis]
MAALSAQISRMVLAPQSGGSVPGVWGQALSDASVSDAKCFPHTLSHSGTTVPLESEGGREQGKGTRTGNTAAGPALDPEVLPVAQFHWFYTGFLTPGGGP